MDPITKEYPERTRYQFASNRPIDGIDLDGLKFYTVGKLKIKMSVCYLEHEGQIYVHGTVLLDRNQVDRATRANFGNGGNDPGGTENTRSHIATYNIF